MYPTTEEEKAEISRGRMCFRIAVVVLWLFGILAGLAGLSKDKERTQARGMMDITAEYMVGNANITEFVPKGSQQRYCVLAEDGWDTSLQCFDKPK